MENRGEYNRLSSILTIIFVIAKLGGVIDWSWWMVFSPLWVHLLITIGIVILAIILTIMSE